MDHTRSLAVELLNEANLSTDANHKVSYCCCMSLGLFCRQIAGNEGHPCFELFAMQVGLLAQLSELIIRKEPALLVEFLPEMAALQVSQLPFGRM